MFEPFYTNIDTDAIPYRLSGAGKTVAKSLVFK